MARVFVIGGGPAGSVFAIRMAELGHAVTLAERRSFPRRCVGESLSPGVLPLLASLGAEDAAEGATPVSRVAVLWEDAERLREDPRAAGRLVDRGPFDARLLDRARARGVQVLQPARLRRAARDGPVWRLTVDAGGEEERHEADFLAHAGGRACGFGAPRQSAGPRTVALYAYWRGARLPGEPRIEAGRDAWFWGVPLPSGLYNTLVFTDPDTVRKAGDSLAERFAALLGRSGLMRNCTGAAMTGPVRATDATPWLAGEPVNPAEIRLGDAAVALDPLSSSGVEKAIQGALAAAVAAHTLLQKPERRDAAIGFYADSLRRTSERHRRWAAGYYAEAARHRSGPFWQARAAGAEPAAAPAPPVDAQAMATRPVRLTAGARLAEMPCLEGDFVTRKPCLVHPALDGPVAYLGGREIAPLLARLPGGLTPLQIARGWSDRIPPRAGLAMLAWLLNAGVLAQDGNDPAGAAP